MGKNIKITRGANINLVGEANLSSSPLSFNTVAIKPTDFTNMTPKLLVKEGVEVKAGTPILFDKNNPLVKVCSPVSGEVVEVNRGAKRKLLEIKILADKQIVYEDFGKSSPTDLNEVTVREKMLEGGVWPFIRQRPYDVVANPEQTPKAIFISGFDSNPLAPNTDFLLEGQEKEVQVAIDALSKLTPGKVHLSTKQGAAGKLGSISGVEKHEVSGPHPAGNVGVQIHHVDPINRGELVWYVNAAHLPIIGKLFSMGNYDASIRFAAVGSEVSEPAYYDAVVGASIESLSKDKVKGGNNRYISGNVFTGTQISDKGYIGFYDSMISVIPEGDYSEFFGWLSVSPKKVSLSHAYPAWLIGKKEYEVDTNNHGEDRAFVVTGQYEKYIPLDIYPMQLLKAIMTGDIEKMEQLGIYEVAPEDFALAEFSCTSKQNLQETIKMGIDIMLKEVG